MTFLGDTDGRGASPPPPHTHKSHCQLHLPSSRELFCSSAFRGPDMARSINCPQHFHVDIFGSYISKSKDQASSPDLLSSASVGSRRHKVAFPLGSFSGHSPLPAPHARPVRRLVPRVQGPWAFSVSVSVQTDLELQSQGWWLTLCLGRPTPSPTPEPRSALPPTRYNDTGVS